MLKIIARISAMNNFSGASSIRYMYPYIYIYIYKKLFKKTLPEKLILVTKLSTQQFK